MGEAVAGTPEFAAFLSYSRSDRAVCERVHRGLESLSRPFFRFRGRRVFHDASDLYAAASLEGVLKAALGRSQYFVLLASRDAARSFWVDFEIRTWLGGHENRPRNVLILLCEGDIVWNPKAGDFDWTRTTALPRAFEKTFESEPLYADLRGLIAQGRPLSLRWAAFRDRLAEIVAPIDGRTKDEIVGRHLMQRRRVVGVVGAAALAIAALGGGLWNRSSEVSRQQAIDRARQQLSRSADVIAAAGDADHWPGALRVAVADAQASIRELRARLPALPQADEIYLRALLGGLPSRVTRVPIDNVVKALTSDDGRRLLVEMHGEDTDRVWDVAARREVARVPRTRVFSRDLHAFAWSEGGGIAVDVSGTNSIAATGSGRPIAPLAITRSGVLVYAEGAAGRAGRSVHLVQAGGRRTRLCAAGADAVAAFSLDESRVAAACADGVRVWDVETVKAIARLDAPDERPVAFAFGAGGRQLALGTTRSVFLWSLDRQRLLAQHQVIGLPEARKLITAIGLDPAGGRIAVTVGNEWIDCFDAVNERAIFPKAMPWEWTADGITADGLSPLIAQRAVPGGLTLFDACAGTRLARIVLGSPIQAAAVNLDARRLTVVNDRRQLFLVDLRPASVDVEETIPGEAKVVAIAEHAPVLALATGRRLWVWDIESGARLLDESGAFSAGHVALSRDGRTLAAIDGATVTVWRCLRGGACGADGASAGRVEPLKAPLSPSAIDPRVTVTDDHVLVRDAAGSALLQIAGPALRPRPLHQDLTPVLLDRGPLGRSRLLLVDEPGARLLSVDLQDETLDAPVELLAADAGELTAKSFVRLPSDAVLVLGEDGGRITSGASPGAAAPWALRKRRAPLRAISRDGRFLAVAESAPLEAARQIVADVVEIVDLQAGGVVSRLAVPTQVAAMRFGAGGHLAIAGSAVAAGDAGFRLRVHEPGAWAAVTNMQLPSRPETLAFGPGDAVVAVGLRDGTTAVVNRAGVRVLGAPQRGRVVYCAFVDGGRRLASIGLEPDAATLQLGPATRAALADRLMELQAFVP